MTSDSPDRFEPSPQQKAKQGKSASKRIALFIFIGAGIIFTLVATSILNSGNGVNGSNAPVNFLRLPAGRSPSLHLALNLLRRNPLNLKLLLLLSRKNFVRLIFLYRKFPTSENRPRLNDS